MFWVWLRWAVLGAAILPSLSYLLIIFAARSFFRHQRGAPRDFTPPVSVLKPVYGLELEAYDNFATFCRQDYPVYEILFGVRDARDAAIPVIRKLIADFPSLPIRLLVTPEQIGSNDKVNKLCGLARAARHGLLVISDADIRVGRGYLRSIASPFRNAQVGAVTSLYTGIPLPSLWTELEAICLSTEFMAAVLMARQLEGVSFGLGATVAIRRECLEEIGGFEALADEAADDHELGSRTRARGHRVELVDAKVKTWCSLRTGREFYLQRLRWTIMTRQARPLGFVGYIFTQGLPLTVLALCFAPTRLLAAGLGAAYLSLRMTAAWTMGVWGLQDDVVRRRWWLVPVWDALAFVLWVHSLFWSRVRWRGVEYRVAGGRLIALAPRPQAANDARTVSS